MNKTFSLINPKLHIWIWLFFIAFEVISVGTEYGQFGHPLAYVQNYTLHILFFYIHALAVMPCLETGKLYGYTRFMVLIFSEYAVYICLNYQLNYGALSFSHQMNEIKLDFGYRFIMGRTWRLSFFLGMSTGYYYLVNYLKQHRDNLLLERAAMENALREKDGEMAIAKATNAALKAQINPHFFASVLNFVYAKLQKSDPELGTAIILLSKMMQFAIVTESDSGKVILASEIVQVRNLFTLCKLIKKDRFYIDFEEDGKAGQLRFIPLVLLTLSENMLKHGDLSNPDQPAYFSVKAEGGSLLIETSNLAYFFDSNSSDRASGLENIRQRLIYEYGAGVSFEYALDGDNRFSVKIGIEMSSINAT